ncbi:MAG: hypothetical protein FDX18_05455 [Chlorobium sp.]|nr:MAG: hypothetical protein FDX18_05455 [Chlorobium sp.]
MANLAPQSETLLQGNLKTNPSSRLGQLISTTSCCFRSARLATENQKTGRVKRTLNAASPEEKILKEMAQEYPTLFIT